MHNSDAVARISPLAAAAPATSERAVAPLRLTVAPTGEPLRVVRLPAAHQHGLEQEGLVEGSTIEVERRVALGGPVIVRLGRARLALARAIANGVVVAPAPPPSANPSR